MRRRGYQRVQGESLRRMIRSVETCGACNGTGADYDDKCRAVACGACGGSGMIEQPNDPSQADGVKGTT